MRDRLGWFYNRIIFPVAWILDWIRFKIIGGSIWFFVQGYVENEVYCAPWISEQDVDIRITELREELCSLEVEVDNLRGEYE